MTINEKEQIKEEYKMLKQEYKSLKTDITIVPSDYMEHYRTKQELTAIIMRMAEIRRQLIDDRFSKFYPTTLLADFILGSEENQREGR